MVSPRKKLPVRKFDDRRIYRRLVSSGREERRGGDNGERGEGSLDRGGPRHSSSEAIEETVNGADKIRGTSLESNGQVSVGHFHFAHLSTSRVCSGMKLLRAGRYVLLVHVSGRTLFFSSLPSVRSTLPTRTGRMACARVTPLVSKGPKSEYHFDSSKSIHIYRNSCRTLVVKQMFSSGRQFENSHRKRPRESCSKLITSYEARHEGEDRGSSPPI